MPMNGPLNTPYENPLMSTPGAGEASMGQSPQTFNEGGSGGLVNSPFESPITKDTSTGATGNMSELPAVQPGVVQGVPDAPAANTQVSVEPGVASPFGESVIKKL